tara:strand:- start:266 stop:787 length:522 start_codon:yes stop_codon:yes gene_type:complete
MNKIIKIILLIFFILKINIVLAIDELPFKNISISKEPIEYKEITFKDYLGNVVNLNNQKSKLYMLNFWATWCLPCKEELPYLDEIQLMKHIQVFPINVGKENKNKTQMFYKNLNIKNLSIYFDIENNLVNLFKLRGIPTTIIFNEERKEIARIIGIVDFSDEKFIKWINNFLN